MRHILYAHQHSRQAYCTWWANHHKHPHEWPPGKPHPVPVRSALLPRQDTPVLLYGLASGGPVGRCILGGCQTKPCCCARIPLRAANAAGHLMLGPLRHHQSDCGAMPSHTHPQKALQPTAATYLNPKVQRCMQSLWVYCRDRLVLVPSGDHLQMGAAWSGAHFWSPSPPPTGHPAITRSLLGHCPCHPPTPRQWPAHRYAS